jgi:hypothetical protein
MGKTYRTLPGVMGPLDVERPEWAEQYAVDDTITFTVPWRDGVKTSRVVGFSSTEENYGLPIILSDDELAENGLYGQIAITREYHVPSQEVSNRV